MTVLMIYAYSICILLVNKIYSNVYCGEYTMFQGAWAPGTEVVARYAFSGTSTEDLPFAKTERLTIVRPTNDPNWVKARSRDGMEGMIPTSYVTECRKDGKPECKKEVKLNTMA